LLVTVIAYLGLKLDALTEEQKIIQRKKLIICNLQKEITPAALIRNLHNSVRRYGDEVTE